MTHRRETDYLRSLLAQAIVASDAMYGIIHDLWRDEALPSQAILHAQRLTLTTQALHDIVAPGEPIPTSTWRPITEAVGRTKVWTWIDGQGLTVRRSGYSGLPGDTGWVDSNGKGVAPQWFMDPLPGPTAKPVASE